MLSLQGRTKRLWCHMPAMPKEALRSLIMSKADKGEIITHPDIQKETGCHIGQVNSSMDWLLAKGLLVQVDALYNDAHPRGVRAYKRHLKLLGPSSVRRPFDWTYPVDMNQCRYAVS